jgi:hypothetical protein
MWRRIKNVLLSFKTYDALSPDLTVQRQVNHRLSHRPALKLEAWFESCWRSRGITWAIATFAYSYLEQYSGLHFARILPDDRLEEDLHWTEVCWFDWQHNLCDDFWRCFQIDLSDRLDEFDPVTVAELLVFLDQQLHWLHDPDQNLSQKDINF